MKNTGREHNTFQANERFQNGVKIVECETRRVIEFVNGRYVSRKPASQSRLVVIDDTSAASSPILTIERRDIAGLNAFLQDLFGTPGVAK